MARPVPCHILPHPKCRNQQLFPLFWVAPRAAIRIAIAERLNSTPKRSFGAIATTASHAPEQPFTSPL
jgi:hypothetical protein